MNKRIYIFSVVAIVIIGAALTVLFTKNTTKHAPVAVYTENPSPSVGPSTSIAPSSTPKKSVTKPKTSPGIVVTEDQSYADWVKWLDPLNRHLVLDKDCTSIVPSGVDYLNDTEIMLDNSASDLPRTLSLGGRNYYIDAHGWIVTTLHSNTLPAQLPIFCGAMELGRLDLFAK